MKKFFAATVISTLCFPVGVLAQERAGDAALGALSGAVVLGPVGAVAGAVVGYTAGPSISHSWGLRRSEPRYEERAAKSSTATSAKAASQITPTPGPAKPTVTQTAAKQVSPPPKHYATGSIGKWDGPPVQGLE